MFITIIIFLLILGILVFIHEFGHFVVAKKMGVRVDEFGFGFPPRMLGIQLIKSKTIQKLSKEEVQSLEVDNYNLPDGQELTTQIITNHIEEVSQIVPAKKWRVVWGRDKAKQDLDNENSDKGTVYSINWIPLGGFVKIKGEQGEGAEDEDSFAHKKVWQRGAIILAGVVMNFLFTVILLSVGYFVGLPQDISEEPKGAIIQNIQVETAAILQGSPADQAGMKVGDVIISLDDQAVDNVESFRNYTALQEGKTIVLQIKRDTEILTKEIQPIEIKEAGRVAIGIGLIKTGLVSFPWYKAIYKGFESTLYLTKEIFAALYTLLKNLVTVQGGFEEVSGPVGIAVLTGRVAKMGFIYLLQFMALLSINLAIINFIPFPALDGGRFLFLIIEKIRRKPVDRKIEAVIHAIGFALLMLLVVVVTFKDVSQYSGALASLWSKIFH
jgi:regulator of sigma E protease